jgi:hypothetical protein
MIIYIAKKQIKVFKLIQNYKFNYINLKIELKFTYNIISNN